MTLKNRNRYFYFLLIYSAILTVLCFSVFAVAAIKNQISIPDYYRSPAFFERIDFLKFYPLAVYISTGILAFYSIFCMVIILLNFGKTQSVEITFFSGFLFCCILEVLKIIPVCFNIWLPNYGLIIFCTKAILVGRLFAPLTFIFAAIMKDNFLIQDSERNYLLSLMMCLVVAFLTPLDTTKFTSTFLCFWGFSTPFFAVRLLLFITAVFSFYIEIKKSGDTEMMKIPLYFAIMFSGYAILISCDNFVTILPGTLLFFFGTHKYVHLIHQNYMWS